MFKTHKYTYFKFIFLTLCMMFSFVVQGNELSIDQNGQRGSIELDLSNNVNDVDVSVFQRGIENLLDAGFGDNTTALIEQTGNYGLIELDTQRGANSRYQFNQTGDHNRLIGDFTGDSNITIINQTGSSNTLLFDVNGNSNALDIDQGGDSNVADFLINGNNVNIDVQQKGSDNNLDVNLNNSSVNMNIIQFGSGETITIDN